MNKIKDQLIINNIGNLFIFTREIFRSVVRQLRTLRLLLMPSNWPAVFSPMLCEPHSSKPILAYVNVIDPIGKTYVNTMKITLYLKGKGENLNSSVNPGRETKGKGAKRRGGKRYIFLKLKLLYFQLDWIN